MTEVLLDRADGVGVVTINVPDRRNALTLPISEALVDAVRTCENDASVHAVVVTGAPPAFCAGADLTALGEAKEEGLRRIYAGFLAFADCALPTVAAVNGAAVGAGLNLALACDVRIAGPKARFDARFLQLGIHPGGGMTWMLQRAVSKQTAVAMTLFSRVLDAESALEHGLVWQIADDPVAAAVQLAAGAVSAPRDLVSTTKGTLRATSGNADHASAVETELRAQLETISSAEFAERLTRLRTRITRQE
ncbi:enoyl-CoA hydratase [Kibdelosporangium phytohabitans]|uniref:Enoyl-CoA hydratase n=1 Tax=Kibdelosporangium phytohabitans TaxID=860235 RepID=A0A0N9IEU9_9PSEU|nr:enoyl-CoA hydratase [Kibdelosporangium phytohabitans]ALG13962.1 enoyl-CoA hydratase [Kibdelosporangium phytohabitans]MBE1467093.1 enoyl-CoA hydratase [Kibdelosporangium phytohabitans]